MLTGRYPKDSVPLSERLQDRLGILLFSLMLFPFVAMAGGMILMGMFAFSHNDRALLIGLPAGFALLLTLAGFVTFIDRRAPRRIDAFDYADGKLTYWGGRIGPPQHRWLEDITFVCRHGPRRGQGAWGYYISFRDGSRIFVSRQLNDADKLFDLLHQELIHRAAYASSPKKPANSKV
ncbi:MAG TPA: hypothetical protein VFB96_16025 [Pirellulaceae bacterium]|nr:hypothetical protein [Pirellulaceae bacterium]